MVGLLADPRQRATGSRQALTHEMPHILVLMTARLICARGLLQKDPQGITSLILGEAREIGAMLILPDQQQTSAEPTIPG
ncbi:MAG: hypothetical protein ACK5N0_10980 [Synechococcaceae cyanobacterium]